MPAEKSNHHMLILLIVSAVCVGMVSYGYVLYKKAGTPPEPVVEVQDRATADADTQMNDTNVTKKADEEAIVLQGTEQFKTGWSEGMSAQQKASYINTATEQNMQSDTSVLDGVDTKPAGLSGEASPQQKVKILDAEVNAQNTEAGAIAL